MILRWYFDGKNLNAKVGLPSVKWLGALDL